MNEGEQKNETSVDRHSEYQEMKRNGRPELSDAELLRVGTGLRKRKGGESGIYIGRENRVWNP